MYLYLKLDDVCIQRAKAVIVSKFYRNETRLSTFSGGTAVDRGLPKFKIAVTIDYADPNEFEQLQALIEKIILRAEFYYNGELTQAMVITSQFAGYEYRYQDDDQTKPLYQEIQLEFEEQ